MEEGMKSQQARVPDQKNPGFLKKTAYQTNQINYSHRGVNLPKKSPETKKWNQSMKECQMFNKKYSVQGSNQNHRI